MLKLIYCLRRKPDLSVEEFQRYWREVHVPLVAERAELLGVKRYIQAHTRCRGDPRPATAQRGIARTLRRRRRNLGRGLSPVWWCNEASV